MIEHIVLFKFKPEEIKEHGEELKSRVAKMIDIPVVEAVLLQETFTKERAHGYTHGLRVAISEAKNLSVYDAHPLHQSVKEIVGKCLDKSAPNPILAVDMEAAGTTTKSGSLLSSGNKVMQVQLFVLISAVLIIGLFR